MLWYGMVRDAVEINVIVIAIMSLIAIAGSIIVILFRINIIINNSNRKSDRNNDHNN